jgi:O-acetylserine/cysteine efflux transporter
MSNRDILLSLAMVIVFGMGWVFAKSALDHFPPILLSAFRFGVAATALCFFIKKPNVGYWQLLLISILAISVPYSLSNIGLNALDVTQTVLLVQMEAPILALLSAILLKDIPSKLKTVGIVIAVAGVIPIAGGSISQGLGFYVTMVVVSMFIWAIGQIMIRKCRVDGGIEIIASLSLFATPQLFVMSFIFESGQLEAVRSADIFEWAQVIYLGLVMTGLGIGIWYYLIGKYPVHFAGSFLLLVPVISILGGVLFLGEIISSSIVIGGIIIIFGVFLSTSSERVLQLLQDRGLMRRRED